MINNPNGSVTNTTAPAGKNQLIGAPKLDDAGLPISGSANTLFPSRRPLSNSTWTETTPSKGEIFFTSLQYDTLIPAEEGKKGLIPQENFLEKATLILPGADGEDDEQYTFEGNYPTEATGATSSDGVA